MSKGQALARIFVPLTKVDEEQRLVYGTISQEILDKSKEVMDYETSKPLFEEWSGDIEKATSGKSKGNVRVMHGLKACGKLTEIDFHDEDKAIDVCAKIVDDDEWEKVQEGVYTGFSVGGKYEKKWTEEVDGNKVKKYTARPMEVSIVDNPCVPTATFSMIKADGAIEEVAFQVEHDENEWPLIKTEQKDPPAGESGEDQTDEGTEVEKTEEPKTAAESAVVGDPRLQEYNPTNDEVAAEAQKLAKADGKDEKDWAGYVEQARESLIKAHNPNHENANADIPKIEKDKPTDKTKTLAGKGPGDTPGTTGADNPANKVTAPGIKQKWEASDGKTFEKKADCEAHEATLNKSEESEEEVETEDLSLEDQLKAALGKVSDALSEAEAARVEGSEDDPVPILSDLDRLSKAVAFIEEDCDEELKKGCYAVSRFADVLASMANLVACVKNNSKDDSDLPNEVKDAVVALAPVFEKFATEQIAMLIANLEDGKTEYYYNAASADDADDLAKDIGELLDAVKEPASIISEQLNKAASPVEEGGEEGGEDSLEKVVAERDSLRKAVEAALPQIADLTKRLEAVESTPLPRAPRNIVEKDGGSGLLKGTTDAERLAEVAELVKAYGPDQLATMMIKASHQTGGHRLNPAS